MKPYIDARKDWFVARTNIKCEEKATSNIRAAGFEVYFPRMRYERKNRRTNTYIVMERPLLLRYIFVGLPKVNPPFGFVRACEGVESLLGVQGRPVKVPVPLLERILDDEMNLRFDDTREARIARKEEARTWKDTMMMRYPKGSLVEVGSGPFASFVGEVAAVTAQGHLDVLIAIFGRAVPVELDPRQVEVKAVA